KLIAALTTYLRSQLAANKVPHANSVELQVLNPGDRALLTAGHTPTLSVVAFLLVMGGALLLVYILENLYPRPAHEPGTEESSEPSDRTLRGVRSARASA